MCLCLLGSHVSAWVCWLVLSSKYSSIVIFALCLANKTVISVQKHFHRFWNIWFYDGRNSNTRILVNKKMVRLMKDKWEQWFYKKKRLFWAKSQPNGVFSSLFLSSTNALSKSPMDIQMCLSKCVLLIRGYPNVSFEWSNSIAYHIDNITTNVNNGMKFRTSNSITCNNNNHQHCRPSSGFTTRLVP